MNDVESLFFYLFSFALSAALFHIGQKTNRKVFTVFAILIPTIIGGLRNEVGVDYVSYKSKLISAQTTDMASFSARYGGMEPALWLFGQLPWEIFFYATSFLTILFFYLGFKRFNTKHIGLCMLLVLLVIFPQALGGVRQGVAMSICFFAFSFVPERHIEPFIISILFAALFHYSSLIMLALYPLYIIMVERPESDKKFVTKLIVTASALVALIVIGFQIIEYIPLLGKYALYTTDEFTEQYGVYTASHNILPEIASLALIAMFYGHLVGHKNKIGRFMMLGIVFMFVITLVGFVVPLASRLADYFIAFFILTFAASIDTFEDARSRRIMAAAMIAYAVLFFFTGIYLNGSGEIFPYRTVFELVATV